MFGCAEQDPRKSRIKGRRSGLMLSGKTNGSILLVRGRWVYGESAESIFPAKHLEK